MSSIYGENLHLSLFGQSHGKAVGMVLDGIPAGLPVDTAALQAFLDHRAPGRDGTTARKEADRPEFLGGIVDGFTCGAPICAVIENTDTRPDDYAPYYDLPRPGHADFPAQVKYGGFQDVSGGGHFSGRLTAPLCIAGGLCLQWLDALDIRIGACITRIGTQEAAEFDALAPDLDALDPYFPTVVASDADCLRAEIARAKADGDSVGGRVQCAVVGLPVGLGAPIFGGIESRLAQILFGIPAVKNVGFGLSDRFAQVRGSESNDPFTVQDGVIRTVTNRCGGILGGLSTGMPLLFDVTFKPTPSIEKPQQTVSFSRMEEATVSVAGRHDPCIVPRAVAVTEAAAAVAVYDLLLGENRE